MLPLAAALFAAAVLLTRRHPRGALVAWLVIVAAVPVWWGVSIVYYFQPASLAGIVVVAGLALRRPGRLGLGDILAAFFLLACLAPLVVGGATATTIFVVLAEWTVGFLIGRLLPASIPFDWICSAIAVVFTLVGLWAIMEYALHWHAFVGSGPASSLRATWDSIQGRGGQERSEGAFGHSIAMGTSIALALPFVLGSRFRTSIRFMMTAVMLIGVVFTFSRVSLVGSVIALLATVFFVKDDRVAKMRTPVLALLGGVAVAVVPLLLTVFAEAGTEASESGEYRSHLGDLIPQIDPLGFSSAASVSPSGVLRFGGFRSIDNALLLTGLTYGAVALAIALVFLVAGAIQMVSRRGSVAVVAVLAQVPALFSVALLTQYSMFFWFVVGLAVATSVRVLPDTRRPLPLGSTLSPAYPSYERLTRAVQ